MSYTIIVIIVMVLCGVIGGSVNFLLHNKSINKLELLKCIFISLGATFLVPLFLNMISSNLLFEAKNDELKLLIFGGFCLIASISSRAFIRYVSDKLLKEVGELKDKVEKVENKVELVEGEVNPIIKSQTEEEIIQQDDFNTFSTDEFEDENEAQNTGGGPDINSKIKLKSTYEDSRTKIIKAFGMGNFTYRTLQGISNDSGISIDAVNRWIGKFLDEGIIAKKCSDKQNGKNRMLYYLTNIGYEMLRREMNTKRGKVLKITHLKDIKEKKVLSVELDIGESLEVHANIPIAFSEGDIIKAVTVDGNRVASNYINIIQSDKKAL